MKATATKETNTENTILADPLRNRTEFRLALGNPSRTTFWRLEKQDPRFPKPLTVGGVDLWRQSWIEGYVSALEDAR